MYFHSEGDLWNGCFSPRNNVMSMLGIDGYVQQLAEGALIVLIIFLDCYSRKLKRERV